MPPTLIMGVLNATPDSFYAGSRTGRDQLAARIEQMLHEGADLIDIGGESTRPGAEAISADQEIDRVLPAIERAVQLGATVSIDTSKAQVAQAAIQAGATWVNDVTGLGDPQMAPVCAMHPVKVIVMHMQGTPRTMQQHPHYDDLIGEIQAFFESRIALAVDKGIPRDQLVLDPGIGFGKTFTHNLSLIKHLRAFQRWQLPILVGASRKAFIGHLLGDLPPEERLEGSLAAHVMAIQNGAGIIRTHDVRATKRAALIADATMEAP